MSGSLRIVSDDTLIAFELLAAFEPLLAAYKDERQYLYESAAGPDGLIPDPLDLRALNDMDALIRPAERVVIKARAALTSPREATR